MRPQSDRELSPQCDLTAVSTYKELVISDEELIGLDEFALLSENAAQAGVSGPLPTVQRIERQPAPARVSGPRWV